MKTCRGRRNLILQKFALRDLILDKLMDPLLEKLS